MVNSIGRFVEVIEESIFGWNWHVVPGIFFDLIEVPDQVHLSGFLPFGALDELPAHKKYGEHPNHCIREEECWEVPATRQENGVPTDEGHNEASGKRVPCDIWLTPAFVG